MAGKEAIMVILDVGSSMHEPYSQFTERTRLDIGAESLKLLIQQKLLFQKSHEIGLILFGSDESDTGDYMVARDVAKLDFAKYADEIREAEKSNLEGGDIFAAIDIAIDNLDNYVKKKKYTKKIFLITNGQGKISYSKERVARLAKKANALETKLNFITIDFCDDEEAESDPEQTPQQNNNQMLLREFVESSEARIFPSNVALSIYRQFRSRSVYPVAKYKGTLDIGPTLQIQVLAYGKTKEDKLPSLKKHSLASPAAAQKDSEAAKVMIARENYIYDDPKMEPVDKTDIIRGFYYGKQLVPVGEELLDDIKKYKAPKCLKLLGFANSKDVPRHNFLAGVEMVIPIQDEKFGDTAEHKKAFASLVHAMYELERVAIVRFVYRDNNAPKLAVLTPHIAKNYECMWLNYLPTVEDLRDYQFNSLKKAEKKQLDVMGHFMDALDLMSCEDEEGDTFEALKINETFNPVLQYFYQCLLYRAFHKDDQLPPLDPLIASYVRPDKKMFDKAQLEISNVASTFPLKENKDFKEKSVKVFWKDVIEQEKKNVEEQMVDEEEEKRADAGDKEKPITFDDEERVKNISQDRPIEDFKKMINDKKEDLTSAAIEQMIAMIVKFITEAYKGDKYDKAIDCLHELRKGCIDEDEVPAFNDFLTDLKNKYSKGKYGPFWDKVVNNAITLISRTENKHSKVDFNEANKFLLQADERAQTKTEKERKEEEADLMADIE